MLAEFFRPCAATLVSSGNGRLRESISKFECRKRPRRKWWCPPATSSRRMLACFRRESTRCVSPSSVDLREGRASRPPIANGTGRAGVPPAHLQTASRRASRPPYPAFSVLHRAAIRCGRGRAHRLPGFGFVVRSEDIVLCAWDVVGVESRLVV